MTVVPAEIRPGAPLLIVGQAPGADETRKGQPFVGPSGRELWLWASRVGFSRDVVSITNVWDEEVPGVPAMTASTAVARAEGWWEPGWQIQRNRWLRPEWRSGVVRLRREVVEAAPRVVLALGNEALWALSGRYGIEARRGALWRTVAPPHVPAIATFHPAAILRGGYRLRVFAVADTARAWEMAAGAASCEPPSRELWLEPTLADLEAWTEKLASALSLGVDIETAAGEITSIAFAPSPYLALCVPFVVDGASYWPSAEEECAAWAWVRGVCENAAPKVLQNGSYDAQWLWVERGIALHNYAYDTRLAHHALFPEWPKSLGFMGSFWERETWWKQWGAGKTEKNDDV